MPVRFETSNGSSENFMTLADGCMTTADVVAYPQYLDVHSSAEKHPNPQVIAPRLRSSRPSSDGTAVTLELGWSFCHDKREPIPAVPWRVRVSG